MGSRRGGWLIVCAFILAAASAAAADLRLAISATPLSAPVIIAVENGYFRQYGLNPIPTYMQGGHRTLKAVLAGEADIATSSEAVVMFNAFARSDFAVLCTFVSSDNDDKILVLRDSRIASVDDLRGKRVGTIRNAAAHFFLSQTLQLAGIPGSAVTIVGIDPENAGAGLESGELDAVAVWEPHGYALTRRFGDRVVALPHDRAYIETFNAIATRAFIEGNPAAAEAVVRALARAVEFIEAKPDQARATVAAALKQDPAVVQAIWRDLNFNVRLDQWLLTTLEAQAAWAKREKLVDPAVSPNFLDFLSLRPLEKINAKAVTVYR
ncbi:MAG: ABC transporter substrate-binding protein [Actinomycetota bacterium]